VMLAKDPARLLTVARNGFLVGTVATGANALTVRVDR
jgi:hypothetical protein